MRRNKITSYKTAIQSIFHSTYGRLNGFNQVNSKTKTKYVQVERRAVDWPVSNASSACHSEWATNNIHFWNNILQNGETRSDCIAKCKSPSIWLRGIHSQPMCLPVVRVRPNIWSFGCVLFLLIGILKIHFAFFSRWTMAQHSHAIWREREEELIICVNNNFYRSHLWSNQQRMHVSSGKHCVCTVE